MISRVRCTLTVLILFSLTALIAGCAGGGPSEYSASDAARGIKLAVGEQAVIALDSNETTGFSWSMAEGTDSSIIKKVGQVYEEPNTGAVGAGGTDRWTFEAVNPGETTVKLEYSRPWATGAPPEKTMQVKFTVTE